MRVYKYRARNDQLLQMVGERMWWFSSFSALNDPYEARFEITASTDGESLERFREKLARSGKPVPEGFVESLLAHSDEILSKVERGLSQGLEGRGVCCFSTDPTSDLMWAHYADNHRGVCLEFEVDDEHFYEVVYGDFPSFDYIKDPVGNWEITVLTRKGPSWAYEREVRLITEDGANKEMEFGPDLLTAVILGARAEEYDQDLLLTLLRAGMNPELRRMVTRANGYGFDTVSLGTVLENLTREDARALHQELLATHGSRDDEGDRGLDDDGG